MPGEQQDRDEILEFLSHQWIPVRQMLRTMSRGDSLTNDIFVNCLVREFRIPNRLIPTLSKIVLESCRYHDVVHTETLRKKVDDYRRRKQEEDEAVYVREHQNDADGGEYGVINNNNPKYYFATSTSSTNHQQNQQQQRPQTSQPRGGSNYQQSSALNPQIYQPPRLQPDPVTQEQMQLLHFQQKKSSQRTADRYDEVFDDQKTKDPRMKNPPLPKTEAQIEREKMRAQMGSIVSDDGNRTSGQQQQQQQQQRSAVVPQPPRPQTAAVPSYSSRGRNVETQTPVRSERQKNASTTTTNNNNNNDSTYQESQKQKQNQQPSTQKSAMNQLSQPKKNYSLDAREIAEQQQQQQYQQQYQQQKNNNNNSNSSNILATHRGCTPKVDLGHRREALRAQFLKATGGVSVVTRQHFYSALNSITPWDIQADEFQELYDGCKQPNGKVHVDDFCHNFVEEYVKNSSSFAVSMKPCFAPITKSPRYFRHPNLSLSRSASSAANSNNNHHPSSAGGNSTTSATTKSSSSSTARVGGDLLSRSSIVAKAQREKEEREREARRVVRLTRSSEFRKEVGALFRKTVDSYDGYIQCGIISSSSSSPRRRPSSAAQRFASIGSAGVANSATVHIPEAPLGTAKFYKVNTRIEADATQLGNQPSPRVVRH